MIYFAYGSNLDIVDLRRSCPRAVAIGAARLDGYRLCFPRGSLTRHCAVAGIRAADAETVWGALYRINAVDEAALDAREGFVHTRARAQNRYNRGLVEVISAQGRAIDAITYFATPQPDPGRPSPAYLEHMIRGAKAHGLPVGYIDMLRGFNAVAAEAAS